MPSLSRPAMPAFPGSHRSASAFGSSRLAQRSLALRPACLPSRPRRPSTPEASAASLPPRLLRLLPAGATVAGRDSHPLKTDACPRRTGRAPIFQHDTSAIPVVWGLIKWGASLFSTALCFRVATSVLKIGTRPYFCSTTPQRSPWPGGYIKWGASLFSGAVFSRRCFCPGLADDAGGRTHGRGARGTTENVLRTARRIGDNGLRRLGGRR